MEEKELFIIFKLKGLQMSCSGLPNQTNTRSESYSQALIAQGYFDRERFVESCLNLPEALASYIFAAFLSDSDLLRIFSSYRELEKIQENPSFIKNTIAQ